MAIQENCQKSSQPHWKIVKKLHGHTGKLSNKYVGSWPYRKIVKKVHSHTGKLSNYIHLFSHCNGHTGKLSKKLTAIQENCQTII